MSWKTVIVPQHVYDFLLSLDCCVIAVNAVTDEEADFLLSLDCCRRPRDPSAAAAVRFLLSLDCCLVSLEDLAEVARALSTIS